MHLFDLIAVLITAAALCERTTAGGIPTTLGVMLIALVLALPEA